MKPHSKTVIATMALISIALIGCATVPEGSVKLQHQSESLSPPTGKAGVYVFRPHLLAGGAVLWKVELDSNLFGHLAPKSYLYGIVSPGEHSVGLGYPASTITFNTAEGSNYYFKIFLGFPGAELVEIETDEGRKLINEFTLSGYNIFEKSNILRSKEFSANSASSNSNAEFPVNNEKTINMGGYTIGYPPGENWKTVVTSKEQKVEFSKNIKDEKGNVSSTKSILIRTQWATDRNMWKLSKQEIAEKYFEKERSGFYVSALLGVTKINEEKEETIYIDNTELYNAYSKHTIEKDDLTMITEQSMYLFFPPGYEKDDKFIVFLVSEGYKPERSEPADLSAVFFVIKSLKLDLEKLNK